MKLNESKDKLPATFVTTYIADAWEKVGYLKADIEGIKKEYSDTKIVVDCLQTILDAYLVAAGRLQAFLDNKDYVDVPEIKVEESLKEDLTNEDVNVDEVIVNVEKPIINAVPPHGHHGHHDHHDHEVRMPKIDLPEENDNIFDAFEPYDFTDDSQPATPVELPGVSWYDLANESNKMTKRVPQAINPVQTEVPAATAVSVRTDDKPVFDASDLCSFDDPVTTSNDYAEFQAMLNHLHGNR